MAIAISEPVAESTSTSNASSYSMTAFTPSANALLVVLVFATGTVASAPTMTGGGLTWSRIGRITYNTTDSAVAFYAQAGASPSSTTVAFDCTGDAATGCAMAAFEVTGHNAAAPISQSVFEQRTGADPNCTRAAANTNNGYIAGFGMPRNAPTSTPPGSWTETSDTGYNSPAAGMSTAYRAGGETSTTVTFTSASAAYGIVYVEVREASVPGPNQTIEPVGIPMSTIGFDTVSDVLGSDLYRWMLDYEISGGTATWTCEIGSGNATQATAANQPTAGTSTSGQSYPDFDGAAPSNQDMLAFSSAITALPTYSASDHFMMGFAFRADSLPDGSIATIFEINSGGGFNDGCISIQNGAGANHIYAGLTARSNSAVTDSTWRTFIAVHNGTTGVVTVYIDGTAQTTTDSSAGLGAAWKTSNGSFGTQPVSTGRRFDGALVSPFFAYRASASGVWDSTTIGNVHTALSKYQEAQLEAIGSPTVTNAARVEPTAVSTAETFGSPTVSQSGQAVQATAVASAEAFGSPQLNLNVTPTGVTSSEAFGTEQLNLNLTATGIASAEAFGSPTLNLVVTATGITSGEAFGSPTITTGAVNVSPTGITSSEAFGSPQLNLNILPTGIAGGEAFGSPTLSLTIYPTGIASAEAFGTPQINLYVLPTGIASAETFGSPTLSLSGGSQSVTPDGVASTEAFGSPQLNLTVLPTDIATSEVFGSPTITPGAVTITLTGVTSAELFGSPQLNLYVLPTGVATSGAFGSPTLTTGAVNVSPTGIASAETFGSPSVTGGFTIQATGIATAEAFGSPTLTTGAVNVLPTGVASSEAFGSPQLNLYAPLTGIASAEAFGSPRLNLYVLPTAIASAEAFGSPQLSKPIYPTAIASAEAFGSSTLTVGAATITLTGISSAGAFGVPLVSAGLVLTPTGIASSEAFGSVSIYRPAPGDATPPNASGRLRVLVASSQIVINISEGVVRIVAPPANQVRVS